MDWLIEMFSSSLLPGSIRWRPTVTHSFSLLRVILAFLSCWPSSSSSVPWLQSQVSGSFFLFFCLSSNATISWILFCFCLFFVCFFGERHGFWLIFSLNCTFIPIRSLLNRHWEANKTFKILHHYCSLTLSLLQQNTWVTFVNLDIACFFCIWDSQMGTETPSCTFTVYIFLFFLLLSSLHYFTLCISSSHTAGCLTGSHACWPFVFSFVLLVFFVCSDHGEKGHDDRTFLHVLLQTFHFPVSTSAF